MGDLLTAKEVARRWSVHPATVRRWLADGLLDGVRTPGGQYRIKVEDVERLLTKATEVSDEQVAAA